MISGVGDWVVLNQKQYEITGIEKHRHARRADKSHGKYREELERRPLDKYILLDIEPFDMGQVIVEEWTCVRLKNAYETWNVYNIYKVRKQRENEEIV